MKLRKLISLAVTAAILMTNAVIISMPTASAATSADTYFTYNFGSGAVGYGSTVLNAMAAKGLYAYKDATLYTNTAAAPYTTYQNMVAKTATGQGSNGACMVIPSFGESYASAGSGANYTAIPSMGIGKVFPGTSAGDTVTGCWEIDFAFKPYYRSNKYQFAISINTTTGRQNIVSCNGMNYCIGYHDYESIISNSAVIDTFAATSTATWYKVKVYLNCDLQYYSVEMRDTSNNLILRKSPISYSGNVKFLGFSALGIDAKSFLFVDDLTIAKAEDDHSSLQSLGREYTIYSDDFSQYSASGQASSNMTSQFSGSSYFSGKYTPWRAYGGLKYFEYSEGAVKLGTSSKSALAYALPGETLVNTSTEPTRGMLDVSFKLKAENIAAAQGFTVNLGAAPESTSQTMVFGLVPRSGYPNFIKVKENGTSLEYTPMHADRWYTIDMKIDVVNRAIKVSVTDESDGSLYKEYVQAPTSGSYMTPTSIGQIIFKAGDTAGSYVYLDDVNISYVTPTPDMETSEIVMTDRFGEVIDGTSNVTAAVYSIAIPMGTILGSVTAANFTLKDENNNTISCTGAKTSGNTYKFGDVYTIGPSSLLSRGKTYTLTALTTLPNAYGETMPVAKTFTFTTTNAYSDQANISGVIDNNGDAVTTLSDVLDATSVKPVVRYANSTGNTMSISGVIAYYANSGKQLVSTNAITTTVAAGLWGTNNSTFNFTKPSFGGASVDKVSIFLWKGLSTLAPYCSAWTVNAAE